MELNDKRKSNQDSEDRISHLPHPILCHILFFLPTKRAAATSILSSRWKFVCTSLSNLCFGNQLCEAPEIINHIDPTRAGHVDFTTNASLPIAL